MVSKSETINNSYTKTSSMNKKLVGLTILILFSISLLSITVMLGQGRIRAPRDISREWLNFSFFPNTTQMNERSQGMGMSQQQNQLPFEYIIPIIAFSGLAVGAIVFYVLSERGAAGFDKKAFQSALLATLDKDEKQVVELLLENQGAVPQYELARLSGLNKLQTHRLILKMEKKGIIKKTRLGKINKIELNKDLKVLAD